MSLTNETTGKILTFLYEQGVFAWRENVLPIPVAGGGKRSGSKAGKPDITGICPIRDGGGRLYGLYFGVEVKTGRDKLRDVQVGFHTTARSKGAVVLVVKDFDDFLLQWGEFNKEYNVIK